MGWFVFFFLFCVFMYIVTKAHQVKQQDLARRRLIAIKQRQAEILEDARKPKAKAAQTFYNSSEWRKLRYQALKLYGAKCACCGRTAKHGCVMHVDHIKPRSKYPHLALEITNLQILCDECNVSKSNTDDIQWR